MKVSKKIVSYVINYLQDKSGENSSKRLAFISSFIIVYYEFNQLISELLEVKAYDQAIDVFTYGAIAMLIMGGFVTAEVFKKNDKLDK